MPDAVSELPASVRAALAPTPDAAVARAFTRRLAHSHYENFSVVSLLLPGTLRQDFCNIYAFCRTADDLGDELGDAQRSLAELERLAERTRDCFAGRAVCALFVALADTIRRHDLPIQPFLDLIDAFKQDQRVRRYETFDQLRDYCRRSADPVGRLVLYLCGYRDEQRQALSDQTCTALQLANFWQDIRRDLLERDRIYLPRQSMELFGVDEGELRRQIMAAQAGENVRRLIRHEVDRTAEFFARSEALLPLLRPRVRRQIALFGQGGRAVLRAIRRQNYDTLSRRPALSKWQKGRLIAGVLAGPVSRFLGGGAA